MSFSLRIRDLLSAISILCGARMASEKALPLASGDAVTVRERLFSGGLEMYLQPVVDLRTGDVSKIEALARLDMNGRIILPGNFLPLLTDEDLALLFRRGLEQCLLWLKTNDARGAVWKKISLSINMPPSYLIGEGSVSLIGEALARYDIEPSRLTIEILETHRISTARQGEAIRALKATGVLIALDDLGSGHSSLLRLANHPFDIIKLDRGLLTNMQTRPVQVFSVVRSLLSLAHDLNCQVVVEGLENAGMIEAMRFIGCEYGQGFGLATPMAQSVFEEWMARRQPVQLGMAGKDAEITTALGACAYLWATMHGGTRTPEQEQRAVSMCHAFGGISAALVAADSLKPLGDWLVGRVTGSDARM